MLSRRELLAAAGTLWLARALQAAGVGLRARLGRVDSLSRALQHRELAQTDWQTQVEAELRAIDLAELCRSVDFERVAARLPQLPRGTSAEVVQLVPGQSFTPKIFALGPGRAIIPHGHDNMVSHHLVLQGRMRGKHYQRLRDEPGHLVVKPTIDRLFTAGDSSSISDLRDNVHWFVAEGRAFTLDCIVDNLDPARGYRFHIDFVDPDRAVRDGDTLRLPRLELDEALQRYG